METPRGKKHANPNHDRTRQYETEINGTVEVRGVIQTELDPSIQEKQDAAEEEKNSRDRRRLEIESWTLISLIFYAAITAFIYWATKRSADAAISAANTAHSALVIGDRPWVGPVLPVDISADTLFDRIEPNVPVQWHNKIKNYGNSPALNSTGHVRGFFENPKTVDWKDVQRRIENLELLTNFQATLFNGEESADSGNSRDPVPEWLATQIANQQMMFILGGKHLYFDAFGAKHITTWCVIYLNPLPGKFPGWHSCPIIAIAN